jgi:hypothetical protein
MTADIMTKTNSLEIFLITRKLIPSIENENENAVPSQLLDHHNYNKDQRQKESITLPLSQH